MTPTAYQELRDFLKSPNTKVVIQHLFGRGLIQTRPESGLDDRALEDIMKKLKNWGIVEESSLLSHEFRQILGAILGKRNFESISPGEIEEIAATWITK